MDHQAELIKTLRNEPHPAVLSSGVEPSDDEPEVEITQTRIAAPLAEAFQWDSPAPQRDGLRVAALSAGDERLAYFVNHPLHKRPVEIVTNAVKAAYLEVYSVVTYRQLGLCFSAPFRAGKTTSASMIASKIKETIPHLAIQMIVAKSHDKVIEKQFFGDLCDSFHLTAQGTAEDRSRRIRKGIHAACQAAGGDQFLMIIDEGQNWYEKQWEWLRDMSNLLMVENKVTLTTATFGDLRLVDMQTRLKTTRQDLWARFMMKSTIFNSIRSKEDLKFFLQQLDDQVRHEYPKGSGIAYSEFFLPRAFEAGWRLESETSLIWDAFVRAAARVNKKISQIGMQWVCDTVVDFLVRLSPDDHAGFTGGDEAWDSAVEFSRFVESIA